MNNTDKVVMGKMQLDKFMQFMYKFLDSADLKDSVMLVDALNKCTDAYIKKALARPIILYVKKGVLSTSNMYVELDNYIDEVINVEHISMLLALANLSTEKQKKFIIRWSIFEIDGEIKQGIGISMICFLEYMQQINMSGVNTVGRINYDKFEKIFFNPSESYIITGKSTCKSISSCLLGVKPNSKKNKYPNKLPENYRSNLSYVLCQKDMEYVYRIDCPFCNKKHSIILSTNDMESTDKYFNAKNLIVIKEKAGKYYGILNCPVKQEAIVTIMIERYVQELDEISKVFLKIFYSLFIDFEWTCENSNRIQKLLVENE